MRRFKNSPRRLRLRRAVSSAALVAACAVVGFAQAEPPRVVVEAVTPPDFPVEIVGVEVAGETHSFAAGRQQPRLLEVSFDAREDWLRVLAFKIKNRSEKTVVRVVLSGWLAAGEPDEIPMGIEASFGQDTDESAFTGHAPRGEPRRLAPGEAADARWSAAEYESLVKFLTTKRPLAGYRRMRIDVREVLFDDRTVWEHGRYYRIDPDDPRKWTPLDGKPHDAHGPSIELKPGERIVEFYDARPASARDADALVVTAITVDGQAVTPGRPFAAGAEWLRVLTLRVRNASQKTITSFQIHLSLPEARYRAGGVGLTFRYGARPGGRGGPNAKPLAPGEEAELSFTGDEYESNRRFVEQLSGLTEVSRLRVGSASVAFSDGTRSLVPSPVRAPKPAPPRGAK